MRWLPIVRWLVCLVYFAAWTQALLTPEPLRIWIAVRHALHWDTSDDPEDNPQIAFEGYLISKVAHLGAYAVMAVLIAWLGASWRCRLVLLGALSLHALGTEFLQGLVPGRHPAWSDVGLDHLGVMLGIGMTWRGWMRRP
jgi:VanZ family protein